MQEVLLTEREIVPQLQRAGHSELLTDFDLKNRTEPFGSNNKSR